MLCRRVSKQSSRTRQSSRKSRRRRQRKSDTGKTTPQLSRELVEAYKVLQVGQDASDAAVKLAYRRQIKDVHPDKLTAQGLPKAMIDVATETTKTLNLAYELIMDSRKK